jgi:hypothetical protein
VSRNHTVSAPLAIGKNGASVQRTLPLNVGGGALSITSAKPIRIYLTLNSPLGDPVTINTSQSFSVSIQPLPIALTQAQVNVANQTINAAATSVDLSSVSDDALINRVRADAHLTIAAHWRADAAATFTVPGGAQIVKSIPSRRLHSRRTSADRRRAEVAVGTPTSRSRGASRRPDRDADADASPADREHLEIILSTTES